MTQHSWHFENRMTSITLPGSGGTVTLKYDPFGRRIYRPFGPGSWGGIFFSLLHIDPHHPRLPNFIHVTSEYYDLAQLDSI
jgi:hypothetical protein